MGAERGRELLERVRSEVVLGDGPMGTMLYQRGIPLGTAFEALNLSDPDLVKAVHRQFVIAGAELIETNTFGANRSRLKQHGLEDKVRPICEQAARLARAVGGGRVFVAGSVGPLGLRSGEDLPPDAEPIFREAVEALAEGGVDVLFLETFVDLDELLLAYKVARGACDLPIVVQLATTENHLTPRGVSLVDACRRMALKGVDGFGTNCGKGPRSVCEAIEHLVVSGAPDDRTVLSAFPNAGFPELVGGRYLYMTTPEYVAESARRLVAAGVSLLGGCCGMTPDDIAAMKVAVRGRKRVPLAEARARLEQEEAERARERRESSVPAEPRARGDLDGDGDGDEAGAARRAPHRRRRPVASAADPCCPADGRLDKLRTARPGGRAPVVIVEIDPPKDLDPHKGIEAAARLKEAGAYAVTVGDNPLAVTRMENLAFSHLVQREADIPVIMHLSCRDRNLIGTQSTLMGAHALGIRAVLGITGDPASIGGQPGASSVYDMNSFGLVELVARLNRGQALPGEQAEGTAFTIGVAFNPNGRRIDDQLRRLKKKVERGAHFAQTQPCYHTARVREMYERAGPLGIPIFLGVLPLYSERAAQFIHNEVPGIDIPEAVFERLRGLSKDKAREEGLRICAEQIEDTLDIADGYYLIPPFSSGRAALELMTLVRDAAARRAAQLEAAQPTAAAASASAAAGARAHADERSA